MELRQIKYFLAVAEEGQITKAAEQLHITQPPLSQQIILLEKELGVQLIERTRKNIKLTEAGTIFYNRAEQIMELIKAAVGEVQEAASGLRGKLAIGTITSSGRSLIPEYIQKFHYAYPQISFDLHQGDSRRIMDLLNTGIIEIGLVRLPIDTSLYNHIVLSDERMMAVALPDMIATEDNKEFELEIIKDKSILIARRYEQSFIDCCLEAGFEPNVLCISDDVTPLMIWAKLGLGVAILPEGAVNLIEGTSLGIREITSFALNTTGGIIWLKKHRLSAAATHFIEMFNRGNSHAYSDSRE